MLVTRPGAFVEAWQSLPPGNWGPPTPRGAMLLSPDGLSAAAVTSADNCYMDPSRAVDSRRLHDQHRALAAALATELPVWVFPGDVATPDATFLNNAFATVPGHLVLGAMRYPERQRETARPDIRAFFRDVLGYAETELTGQGVVAELTGSLVIDRRRGVGFCGLSERCNLAGARAMHDALGLRLTYAFELSSGEYHTNVVMSVLAGRTLVLCREGLADAEAAQALLSAYGDAAVELSVAEKNAFAGNCIALRDGTVWMSAAAAAGLTAANRARLANMGWQIRSVELDEIEKAGGSLRCCVAELF